MNVLLFEYQNSHIGKIVCIQRLKYIKDFWHMIILCYVYIITLKGISTLWASNCKENEAVNVKLNMTKLYI